MRPEKDLAAAHCATEWAQKFVFLLTFLALYEMEARRESMVSEITEEIRQSRGCWGCCRDIMTTSESPSMMKFTRLREDARVTTKLVAKASP
jgi:hypothetical protein